MSKVNILIVYHSKHGNTHKMAKLIARGVESTEGAQAILRSVDPMDDNITPKDLIVSDTDVSDCDGLIIGSPAQFGKKPTIE